MNNERVIQGRTITSAEVEAVRRLIRDRPFRNTQDVNLLLHRRLSAYDAQAGKVGGGREPLSGRGLASYREHTLKFRGIRCDRKFHTLRCSQLNACAGKRIVIGRPTRGAEAAPSTWQGPAPRQPVVVGRRLRRDTRGSSVGRPPARRSLALSSRGDHTAPLPQKGIALFRTGKQLMSSFHKLFCRFIRNHPAPI